MRCSPSACGCARSLGCHALVHVGAHGTLEWLPGKTVALSAKLLSRDRHRRAAGHLSLHRQQSRRGSAGQAAHRRRHARPSAAAARRRRAGREPAEAGAAGRRICAGRRARPPPPRPAGEADRRDRRDRPALPPKPASPRTDAPDEALRRIDAWLCDLKDFAIKDGLHVYGRAPMTRPSAMRRQSAEAERAALLAALDGRHVARRSGRRAGARPHRRAADRPQPLHRRSAHHADADRLRPRQGGGRRSAAPLHAGPWRLAALAGHRPLGLAPRCAPAARRSRKAWSLMGCRPQWDAATGRVTGIEVLPPATLGRPRVDVTWRISGLFRDMFPTQIALIDAAAAAVAARDEDACGKPAGRRAPARRAQRRRASSARRPAPMARASRTCCRAATGQRAKSSAAPISTPPRTPMAAPTAKAIAAPGAFADRIAEADLLVHTGDDPGRDILEGSADVAFIGGFSAALAALGRQCRRHRARHDRPETPAPALASPRR